MQESQALPNIINLRQIITSFLIQLSEGMPPDISVTLSSAKGIKTGWNFMYVNISSDGETVTYTTSKPSGVNFQWMYIDASDLD